MGAIIGSLYAMGYSPDDMEALLRSPDFKRWYSGKVEPKYEYYFKKNRPSPEFFNIRFALFKSPLVVIFKSELSRLYLKFVIPL